MDVLRIKEKNILNDRIKQLTLFIEHDTKTLDRYKNMDSQDSFCVSQITKLTIKNDERFISIKEAKQLIISIDLGDLDLQLSLRLKNNTLEAKVKNDETIRKKKLKNKPMENLQKHTYQRDYSGKASMKEMEKSYQYYLKLSNGIPDYIIDKLKNMPNNKGYIWNGINCYGYLPRERGVTTTLYEKQRNNSSLLVHEYNSTNYKIFERNPKCKDKCIKNMQRRDLHKYFPSIMDYIKK